MAIVCGEPSRRSAVHRLVPALRFVARRVQPATSNMGLSYQIKDMVKEPLRADGAVWRSERKPIPKEGNGLSGPLAKGRIIKQQASSDRLFGQPSCSLQGSAIGARKAGRSTHSRVMHMPRTRSEGLEELRERFF